MIGSPPGKAALRLGLGVLVLSAALLLAAPSAAPGGEAAPRGMTFVVQCAQTGAAGHGGGIGPVSCALKVSGLPDPLQRNVDVTLLSIDDAGDIAGDAGPGATFVSAEAPPLAPGPPVLVSRRVPMSPLAPPSISPRVPEQPPRSV